MGTKQSNIMNLWDWFSFKPLHMPSVIHFGSVLLMYDNPEDPHYMMGLSLLHISGQSVFRPQVLPLSPFCSSSTFRDRLIQTIRALWNFRGPTAEPPSPGLGGPSYCHCAHSAEATPFISVPSFGFPLCSGQISHSHTTSSFQDP